MLAAVLVSGLLLWQAPLAPGCEIERARAFTDEARREHELKHYELAAAKFLQALELCPEKAALRLERANSLLMAGRARDARTVAVEVLRFDPANAQALKLKGNAEYLGGDSASAIETFLALLDRYPSDDNAAYMLGRIYYHGGRIEEAVGQFERVLRINPRSYKAWDNLGLCWQAAGNRDKASAHFLKAIMLAEEQHANYDWAYANLAELLMGMEDNEHAFSAASKAVNRNPTSARNFYIGAKALNKLGKTDLCLNWLERAVSLDPTYPEPQYLLMRVYQKAGQKEKAEQAAQRFQALKLLQDKKQVKSP